MIWSIPVCLLVAGLLYIFVLERGDKANEAPDTARVEPAPEEEDEQVVRELDDTLFVERERVIFPTDQLDHIESLIVNVGFNGSVKVNGQLNVVDGKIVDTTNVVALAQVSDVVSDFDLKVNAKFQRSGATQIFLGWNADTKSGYVLKYDRLVNYAGWYLAHARNGHPTTLVQAISPEKISQGELRVQVSSGELSISIDGKSIASQIPLPDYQPGVILFGTGKGYYPNKGLSVESINIVETPARKPVAKKTDIPAKDILADSPTVNIFPGNAFRVPANLPIIGSSGNSVSRATVPFTAKDGFLHSQKGEINAIELDSISENFELKVIGEMRDLGLVYWLIGWDQTKSKGYRIDQHQLKTGGAWEAKYVDNAKVTNTTLLLSQRLPVRCEITIRVIEKLLKIEVDNEVVIEQFLLDDYQPGSLLMGTASGRYGGRSISIESITIKEL